MSTDPAALLALRQQIDAIDDELLQLVNRRAALAQSIGQVKARAQAQISVMRPEREAQIVRRLQAHNPGPLSAGQVQHVFKEVMSVCRALEHEVRVAFLGPWGTYSEEALWSFFGREVQANPEASIEDTIRALQVGTVDFAVVPGEKYTEG
jgi:chorismate mutase/prephenate dehydratase